MDRCKHCGNDTPAGKTTDRRQYVRTQCDDCKRAYHRTYQSVNDTPERRRYAHLLRKYNLTRGRYDAMLSAQGGRCAVCRKDNPGANSWHVDHDHACCDGPFSCGGCIRGLLCGTCNQMLGQARDDVLLLAAGIEYLTHGGWSSSSTREVRSLQP